MEYILTALVVINGAMYEGEVITHSCRRSIEFVKEQVIEEIAEDGDTLQISFTCALSPKI